MSLLESVDAGIPVSETEFVQVLGGADCFEYYGGLASNACVTGQMMDTPHAGGHKDSFCYPRREPLGVCAGIGAWNYPVLVMSWKVAPALACGNTFVYKPSECTPLTALKIAEILKEVRADNYALYKLRRMRRNSDESLRSSSGGTSGRSFQRRCRRQDHWSHAHQTL